MKLNIEKSRWKKVSGKRRNEMKKALVITSVASMVDQFLLPNVRLLQDIGYEVHVACNFEKGNTCSNERIVALKTKLDEWDITYCQIDFARDVTKVSDHLLAYKQVKKIICENKYELIHCHSPIGGLITRFACRKARKNGTKVFYTAHGFHFYKGAPFKNWLLYYPVEKICAHYTDVLITINHEDYALAKKKMKAKRVEYVPGVGIDLEKFGNVEVDRVAKRQELGIPEDATLLLSVGELNENKNHETVIRAIADMDVCYIIAGKGGLQEHLQGVIEELGMTDRVKLLGFRRDVEELCRTADVFVFPSFREGLSVSVMEAMASGLPIACSNIRGNTDLVDENGGDLFEPSDLSSCKVAIDRILSSNLRQMGAYNLEKVNKFSLKRVNEQMSDIIKRLTVYGE